MIMGPLLTIVHVLAAVLLLGPVTVAVSQFQVQALKAHEGDTAAGGAARVLYRITQTYGMLSLLVPLVGFAIMFTGNYWHEGRFHVSLLLSIIGWALLLFVIMPRQKTMMGTLELTHDFQVTDWKKAKSQLAMFGGIFSLLWVVTAILMMLPRIMG